MTALAILAGLFALGFARYEVPAMNARHRRKLERDRLEREAKALASEQARAALALAIDKKWREFGCARGMTEAELACVRMDHPTLAVHERGSSHVPVRPWMSAAASEIGRWMGRQLFLDEMVELRPRLPPPGPSAIPRKGGYSAKRRVNPRTVRPPKGGTAVTPASNPTRPSKRRM